MLITLFLVVNRKKITGAIDFPLSSVYQYCSGVQVNKII